jgi:hypothetical protein
VSVIDISVSGNVVGSAARSGDFGKYNARMGKCTFIFPFLVGGGGGGIVGAA